MAMLHITQLISSHYASAETGSASSRELPCKDDCCDDDSGGESGSGRSWDNAPVSFISSDPAAPVTMYDMLTHLTANLDVLAIDLEHADLEPSEAGSRRRQLTLLQIAAPAAEAADMSAHIYLVDMLDAELTSELLGPKGVLTSILENPSITKVCHDAREVGGWQESVCKTQQLCTEAAHHQSCSLAECGM